MEVFFKDRMPTDFPTGETDVTDADASVATQKKKWVKLNKDTVCALSLALLGDQVFAFISASYTVDWPNGLAYLIIRKELCRKFQPSDGISKLELQKQLTALGMDEFDDPTDLFNKISAIKIAFSNNGSFIDDDTELIPSVVRCIPSVYDQQVMKVMQDQGNAVTLDDIQEVMEGVHCFATAKLNAATKGVGRSGKETALAAFGTALTPTCYKCAGAVGHKANDPKCPLKGKPGNGKHKGTKGGGGGGQRKFTGKCNLCGMKGHMKCDCFELEGNAHKRPTNWKTTRLSPGETGAAAVGNAASLAHEVNFVAVPQKKRKKKSNKVRIDYSFKDAVMNGPVPMFGHMHDDCTCGHHLRRRFEERMNPSSGRTKTTHVNIELI